MVKLYFELKRRNVFRAAAAYIVTAWLILQVVDVLGDILGLPGWVGQLTLLALLVGSPIILTLSWLYELTPEGIQRERNAEETDPKTAKLSARKLDRAIIGVLTIAVAFLVASNYLLPRFVTNDLGVSIISVAVLPFVNMSSDPETEYFSDGLSEELLNVLAQVRDFRVPGRTSSFAFKGRNEDLRSIGALLNVRHILEGSVRQQDDRIRITAQLNDVETGYHVWSKTYDRTLNDIFQTQDDIATEVVSSLKETLLEEDREVIARRATDNAEAYQKFLRGLHFQQQRTPEGNLHALDEFTQAVELDPEYSSAYAGQVLVYGSMWNGGVIDQAELLERGDAALVRALELDSNDYWVQYAKGVWTDDRDEKRAAYRRAIELNPSEPKAYIALAWSHPDFIEGAPERLELLRKAYEVDPLSLNAVEQYSIQLMNVGQEDKALGLLRDLREFNSDWLGTYETSARIHDNRGRLDQAAVELTTLLSMHPDIAWIRLWLARLNIAWGDIATARENVAAAEEIGGWERLAELTHASLLVREQGARAAYDWLGSVAEAKGRFPFFHVYLAQLALLADDAALATEHIDAYFAVRPDNWFADWHMTAAIAYQRVGRTSDAVAKAQWVIDRATRAESLGQVHWLWPQSRGAMRMLLGDREGALEDLRAAIDQGYVGLPLMGAYSTFPQWELFFADLIDDEQFRQLRAEVDARLRVARQAF